MKPNRNYSKWVARIKGAPSNGNHSGLLPDDAIAEVLAAFEAEVTGWKPITDDLPEDSFFEFMFAKNDNLVGQGPDALPFVGKVEVWGGQRFYCAYDQYGEQTDHDAGKPAYYREITLPAQPEKEGE